MLTVGDRTVPDCLEIAEEIAPLGLHHVGFKDVGVPVAMLEKLHAKLKAGGATTHSLVMRSRSGTIRSIRSEHKLSKLRAYADVDFEH